MEEDQNRKNFLNTIGKTEDDFEKKITQISAGSLALSISFIDKIVDLAYAEFFWILIIGWFLLASTLSINLTTILISRKLNMKSLNDYDIIENKKITEKDENNLLDKIEKRNNIITNLDFIQLGTLLIGILFVVLFSSININNTKINKMPNKEKIEKGRTIQKPQTSPRTNNNNQSGNSGSNSNGNQTNNPENKD